MCLSFFLILSYSYLGGKIPNPIRHWHESSLPSDILDVIYGLGYTVSDIIGCMYIFHVYESPLYVL